MVIASLNGTHAQGFVEVVERSDGSIERTGLLKFSAPDAVELLHSLGTNGPIIYTGPVLANGRWRADTFCLAPRDVAMEWESEEMVSFTIRAEMRNGSQNGHHR